jgi:hypothetical protein
MSEGWHKTARGWRKVYSDRTARQSASEFPCPHLVRPFSSPVQSMADGKFYDDPASLRATYKAQNNPQGVDYVEVGNEDITKFEAPKVDRAGRREAIKKAIADVKSGRVPPVLDKLPG